MILPTRPFKGNSRSSPRNFFFRNAFSEARRPAMQFWNASNWRLGGGPKIRVAVRTGATRRRLHLPGTARSYGRNTCHVKRSIVTSAFCSSSVHALSRWQATWSVRTLIRTAKIVMHMHTLPQHRRDDTLSACQIIIHRLDILTIYGLGMLFLQAFSSEDSRRSGRVAVCCEVGDVF